MRHYEFAASFYLLSEQKHRPGTRITASSRIGHHGAVIEGILEGGRPDHCMPREDCILIHSSSSHKAPYVYEVEALEPVERYHSSWLRLLIDSGQTGGPQVEDWVASFWSGSECPSMHGIWEFYTPAVKVVKLIGGTAVQKPEPFDWMKAVSVMKAKNRDSASDD